MGNKGFLGFLAGCASFLDEKLRFCDFNLNRTADGRMQRTFGISRHSYHFAVFPALLAGIVVMGVPELGSRLFLSVLAFGAAFLLVVVLTKLSIRRRWSVLADLVLQAAVVLGAAGAVWFAGGETYREAGGVYRHFFVAAVAIVAAAILAAGFSAELMWRNLRRMSNYGEALTKTELFSSRDQQPCLGWGTLLGSFCTVLIGAPLQLLILPAIVALFAPPHLLVLAVWATFACSYFVLLMGGIDPRLEKMWRLLQNFFFRGGALLVSLTVIALAAARFYKVDYVTTVFDTAEGVVIALLLVSAYVLLWWYDYWVNRLIAQALLRLMKPEAACEAQIPYAIEPGCAKTGVSVNGRVLQVHGSARFIAIGSAGKRLCFEGYALGTLFEALAAAGAPGGKASPSPGQIAKRIYYHKFLAALALGASACAVGWHIHTGVQEPQLEVANAGRPGLQLAELLVDTDRQPGQCPLLLIAASGGGTRAALYTASVLEGLATRGQAQNVIMGSGVSGGGAALAYFAGSRPELVGSPSAAWDGFFDQMKQPFIKDVLNGALEWRIVSHSRLGLLLSESFKRRWGLPDSRNELGEVADFGLILNTAVAGRFQCDPRSEECTRLPLREAERRFRKTMTSSELAGGRLILTNLALGPDFMPSITEAGGPAGLPVVVHDPLTRLEVAAALNANFPPVFSNAAIDVAGRSRYWITDGGAADNRGVEMLLFALRAALGGPREPKRPTGGGVLPRITVVVADASGFSKDYRQDRGVGSLAGAGTQFASLLVAEQLRSIRELYEQAGCPDSFRFVYLPMPLCLRESGSFGTHWMLQPKIEVQPGSGGSRTLTGDEMIRLLRVLHGSGRGADLSADAQTVLEWARADAGWVSGARQLGWAP